MLDTELDRLLAGLCDGTLDDDEMRTLGERIAHDENDRRSYLQYLDLHAALLGEAPCAAVTESLGQLESSVAISPRRGRSWVTRRTAGFLALSLAGFLLAIGGMAWWNQQPLAIVPPLPVNAPSSLASWARITDVVGEVELDGQEQPLLSGVELTDGETVRTGSDDSYAVIELADGSRLLLCPESQLRLTRDDITPGHLRLVLSAGVLEADVPKLLDHQQLLVVTPQAEIAVRETRCVVSAPDASSTAIETSQGQVSVLRTADGRQTEVPAGHFAVAFHQDRELTVRPVSQLPTQPHAQLDLEQARAIAFRGNQAIVAASSEQLAAFDRASNEPLLLSPLNKDASQHLVTAAESGLIGQIDRTGLVQIFDAQSGSAVTTLETGIRSTNSAALNKSGDLLAIADRRSGWYSAARIWDLSTPTEQEAIEVTGHIRVVSVAQDGQQVALAIERARGFDYHRVEIWTVSPPKLVQRISLADRPLRFLTFSPDGLKLAGANDRGSATVWDTQSGAELQHRGHAEGWTQPLTSLAFHPLGDLLAAGTNNGRVRLWNVATAEELGVLTCGHRIISALAFSPDGQELAVGAVRGKVLLYRLPGSQNSGSEL